MPKTTQSKLWVCVLSLAGIVVSNPAGFMIVCLCVVMYRPLRRAYHSSGGVQKSMACLSVILKPHNEGALAIEGVLRHGKEKVTGVHN